MLLYSSAIIAFINPEDPHNSTASRKISMMQSLKIHEVFLAESLVHAYAFGTTSVFLGQLQWHEWRDQSCCRASENLPDCYVLDACMEGNDALLSFDTCLIRG